MAKSNYQKIQEESRKQGVNPFYYMIQKDRKQRKKKSVEKKKRMKQTISKSKSWLKKNKGTIASIGTGIGSLWVGGRVAKYGAKGILALRKSLKIKKMAEMDKKLKKTKKIVAKPKPMLKSKTLKAKASPSKLKAVAKKPIAKKPIARKKIKKAVARKPIARKKIKKVMPKKAVARKPIARKKIKKVMPKKAVARKPIARKKIKKVMPKKAVARKSVVRKKTRPSMKAGLKKWGVRAGVAGAAGTALYGSSQMMKKSRPKSRITAKNVKVVKSKTPTKPKFSVVRKRKVFGKGTYQHSGQEAYNIYLKANKGKGNQKVKTSLYNLARKESRGKRKKSTAKQKYDYLFSRKR